MEAITGSNAYRVYVGSRAYDSFMGQSGSKHKGYYGGLRRDKWRDPFPHSSKTIWDLIGNLKP